ncbi:MAG: hypothetical protein A2268_03035 [Candidatus Raymondbacteria bacterium RifOxyA12_full_50_37]|uniref:Uncharacterized protein n=1 Tax=Candidatus Raymondbacteria bacterium RIFOXYD12_FULL_49_13 TaxID=1817890 RepID=A0A1F7F910_UNCRA|nr:MAG: hypothetical protein A2268_03035 [Candidatus Raymondbacteria bacterium RifOxyA12_full_50_37]OGJ92944.1 MAG: hypothetical protein A2350_04900 [Candidatus Raymondbacteria bacterium RifOxyB12_full_50_8]OGJ98389.1 MAG: hypothetical protein A2453_09045 [Candidatus Raymondbacteria bacterium RIFOXYC2_FULL_50_21]OGK03113.1 MAG: hypothetical protein A2519_06880 [Candidatus Raymondbacteria bacterium RIFOXYD12_FULL_49_13]OGK06601.1 MAG: hypothetical protein A2487_03005 [Candidatus Raymondbacteria 
MQISSYNKVKIDKLKRILSESDPWRDFDKCKQIYTVLHENKLLPEYKLSSLLTELDAREMEAKRVIEAETKKKENLEKQKLKKTLEEPILAAKVTFAAGVLTVICIVVMESSAPNGQVYSFFEAIGLTGVVITVLLIIVTIILFLKAGFSSDN